MNQYLNNDIKFFPSESFERGIALYFTDGILSLFTLISGYFMAQKHVDNFFELIEFYKRRFLRFGIPLFISCMCLYIIGRGYIAGYHIVTIWTGTSGLLPLPFPKTLWYFSMIIMFYLLTPCLLLLKQKSIKLTIVVGGLVFAFFYLGNKCLWFDIRLSEYWPFFFVPFSLPDDKDIMTVFKLKSHFVVTLLIIIFYLVCFYYQEVPCYNFIMFFSNMLVCYLVLSLSTLIENVKHISSIFCHISFASMFAYLFHREILIVSQCLIRNFSYLQGFIISVFLFFISYYMQYVYNKYSKKLFRQ